MTPSRRAFTLIEILIAVTISAFVFAGLITFVSSWLTSVTRTEKSVSNSLRGAGMDKALRALATEGSITSVWTGSLPSGYVTGVLLANENGSYPYVFLGAESFTGYCNSNPTAQLTRLVAIGGYAPRSGEQLTSGAYVLDPESHSLFSGSSRILGTGEDWSNLNSDPLSTELSHPSSIAVIGTTVYVADTGNSRVLAYDSADNSVSELVTPYDAIISPTSLKAETGSLLIWAKNGLFRMRESSDTGDSVSLSLTGSSPLAFDSIELSFSGISMLTGPVTTANVLINGVTQDISADTVSAGAVLTYVFSGWVQVLPAWTALSLKADSISPAPTTAWNYVLHLRLLNGWSEVYENTFPYFVKGDGSMKTRAGQIIEKISEATNVSTVTNGSSFGSGKIDLSSFLSGTGIERLTSGEPVDQVALSRKGDLLTLSYRAFDVYDCTSDENHRISSHIKKIRVRDSD